MRSGPVAARSCFVAVTLLALTVDSAGAAIVVMPPRMPKAAVAQDVGLTRISVDYRSPAVGGHQIWGARVPFGQPWRTGDSPQATIAFSRDVHLAGTPVPAGTYALVATPSPHAWTLAIFKDSGGVAKGPVEVARLDAPVEAIEPRERLRFSFSSFTTSAAQLDLEWDRVRVSLPIAVDTNQQIVAAIAALDRRDADLGREYREAATYLLSNKHNEAEHKKGLAYLDRASALGDGGDGGDGGKAGAIEAHLLEGPSVAPALLPGATERAAPAVGVARVATRAPGPDEIGPVVKKGRAAIASCYQRVLRHDPSLAHGRINVSIAIGTVGLVKSVVVEAPEGLRPVEPCVKAAISRWVFPASPEPYSAELPLVLDGRN
jgi:Protein of unknown function (DUF2911)